MLTYIHIVHSKSSKKRITHKNAGYVSLSWISHFLSWTKQPKWKWEDTKPFLSPVYPPLKIEKDPCEHTACLLFLSCHFQSCSIMTTHSRLWLQRVAHEYGQRNLERASHFSSSFSPNTLELARQNPFTSVLDYFFGSRKTIFAML